MKPRVRIVLFAVLLVAALVAVVPFGNLIARGERNVDKPADHTAQWQWLHGREAVEDLGSCQKCHKGESCTTCHIADWPHQDGFLRTHGKEALKLDGKGCYLCHRTSYCDGCHGGVRMPHESGYLGKHFKDPVPTDVCMRCHVSSDCASCHDSHANHRVDGSVR